MLLDVIEEDKRDEEVEKKREENRKRKSEEGDKTLRVKGLKVMSGWEDRAKESKDNPIWCRTVEREENGTVQREKNNIPLPEHYDMGLDSRGMGINSANRKNTYFGSKKKRTPTLAVIRGL